MPRSMSYSDLTPEMVHLAETDRDEFNKILGELDIQLSDSPKKAADPKQKDAENFDSIMSVSPVWRLAKAYPNAAKFIAGAGPILATGGATAAPLILGGLAGAANTKWGPEVTSAHGLANLGVSGAMGAAAPALNAAMKTWGPVSKFAGNAAANLMGILGARKGGDALGEYAMGEGEAPPMSAGEQFMALLSSLGGAGVQHFAERFGAVGKNQPDYMRNVADADPNSPVNILRDQVKPTVQMPEPAPAPAPAKPAAPMAAKPVDVTASQPITPETTVAPPPFNALAEFNARLQAQGVNPYQHLNRLAKETGVKADAIIARIKQMTPEELTAMVGPGAAPKAAAAPSSLEDQLAASLAAKGKAPAPPAAPVEPATPPTPVEEPVAAAAPKAAPRVLTPYEAVEKTMADARLLGGGMPRKEFQAIANAGSVEKFIDDLVNDKNLSALPEALDQYGKLFKNGEFGAAVKDKLVQKALKVWEGADEAVPGSPKGTTPFGDHTILARIKDMGKVELADGRTGRDVFNKAFGSSDAYANMVKLHDALETSNKYHPSATPVPKVEAKNGFVQIMVPIMKVIGKGSPGAIVGGVLGGVGGGYGGMAQGSALGVAAEGAGVGAYKVIRITSDKLATYLARDRSRFFDFINDLVDDSATMSQASARAYMSQLERDNETTTVPAQ